MPTWPPPGPVWSPVGPPPSGYGPWTAALPPSSPWGQLPPGVLAGGWPVRLRRDYASWGRRAVGAVIDAIPGWVASTVLVVAYLPTYLGFFRGDLDVPPRYPLLVVGIVLHLAAFGLAVWNRYFLAGRTGQTLGKRVMGTWLVGRASGRPVGPLDAFVRDLLHVLDSAAYVGYLWPLWDEEHQTLADKIAQTVVVRTPVPPLAAHERRT